jgi:hypothetical protein
LREPTIGVSTGIAAHLLAVGPCSSLRTTCLPTLEHTANAQLFPRNRQHANLARPRGSPTRAPCSQSYSPSEDERFAPTATWRETTSSRIFSTKAQTAQGDSSSPQLHIVCGYKIARNRPGGSFRVCRFRTCNAMLIGDVALASCRWHCTINSKLAGSRFDVVR